MAGNNEDRIFEENTENSSDKIFLTVIVPVYNLENYIESLINQSYHNMEILVIDDDSTDRTYELLKEYQASYCNIQLIRNDINRGVSYCRNYGLSLIKTKYVAFLNGDDWIDSNCYSKAISKLETDNRIDIVLWNINTVYSRTHYLKRYFYDEENTISPKYALKLYSKSLNSNIYIKCLLYANSIQLVTNANLYYLQRDNSVMHSFSEHMILELFDAFSKFHTFLIENFYSSTPLKDISSLSFSPTLLKGFYFHSSFLLSPVWPAVPLYPVQLPA